MDAVGGGGAIPRKLGFIEVGRRPLEEPSPGGSGVGVVWRLTKATPTRQPADQVT